MIVKSQLLSQLSSIRPSELRTEKQIAKAIAQEIGTAQILQAKVYIVTDGKKTFGLTPLPVKKFYRKMVAALH